MTALYLMRFVNMVLVLMNLCVLLARQGQRRTQKAFAVDLMRLITSQAESPVNEQKDEKSRLSRNCVLSHLSMHGSC